jgi:uncharacterized protein (TIGR02246 family)
LKEISEMLKRLSLTLTLLLTLSVPALAQNTNSSTTRPARGARGARATTPTPSPTPAVVPAQDATTTPAAGQATGARPAAASPTEAAVRDAFDTLINGIRRADADAVMGVYWNSPQLTLFNNNGTVTKSWQQVRANRQSSYPNLKDVKLDVRDVRVHVLSPTSAVVTCLWTQSQTVREQSETATGRLTLIFQRINNAWKVVHTHTSPDRPDPSLLPPSERTTEPPSDEPATTTRPPARP